MILQLAALVLSATTIAPRPANPVLPNDNRTPAGVLINGVLTLKLRAAIGTWKPKGDAGTALTVEAFGEEGRALSIPAPLIRIPEGTAIAATITNELTTTLRVHGLCDRQADRCEPVAVAPGETQQIRFAAETSGTYHYWATSTGMPLAFRAGGDGQLSGAFVVDPAGSVVNDRIFVITEWEDLTRAQFEQLLVADDPGKLFMSIKPDVLFTINGLAWPHTERLEYALGDTVRWRVLNMSTQNHPMHMHGFYFTVDSQGDGLRDRTFAAEQRSTVVTQLMRPGSTLAITWTPERVGNWLFHCHVMTHVSPTLHVDGSQKPTNGHSHAHHDPGLGMTGMVLGVTVTGPESPEESATDKSATPRRMTLLMNEEPGRFGAAPALAFALDGDRSSTTRAPIPGPTLVLTRGEPVEITLVNQMREATAIHWHGMELESYYDGVHGWSGSGKRTTPMIEPGSSFVVKFTPPRAGTFMYHTHLHDHRQLTSGLFGAMIVQEPGEAFDSSVDHVVVLAKLGPALDAPTAINDSRQPAFVFRAGTRHRLRLINITPDETLSVTLQTKAGPVNWRPLTKDGAPVPAALCKEGPAQQVISVGEIYDFEYQTPPGRQTLWLEVRTLAGKWLAQGHIIVRP
jgi:FtsP/CotA-like multicopper oxidase with cupredoxin domain